MHRALELAKTAASMGEVPVGAVIACRSSGEIIAEGYNLMQNKNNSLMHAEIMAINIACDKLNSKCLSKCDIYINLEPCSMCASAIAFSRLSRLFYGAGDKKQGAVEHGSRYYNSNFCYHRPEIYPDIERETSAVLVKNFFINIRKNNL